MACSQASAKARHTEHIWKLEGQLNCVNVQHVCTVRVKVDAACSMLTASSSTSTSSSVSVSAARTIQVCLHCLKTAQFRMWKRISFKPLPLQASYLHGCLRLPCHAKDLYDVRTRVWAILENWGLIRDLTAWLQLIGTQGPHQTCDMLFMSRVDGSLYDRATTFMMRQAVVSHELDEL